MLQRRRDVLDESFAKSEINEKKKTIVLTFKGVRKGLANRIRRICSSSILHKEQSLRVKTHLCKRGYEAPKVQAVINEVSNKDKQLLLQYKEKLTGDRVAMVTTYHPVLKGL